MGDLNLPTISSGQLQPFETSNDADAALESALTELLVVDLSGGDHALTGAEFTRAILFQTTGNSVARTLSTPATRRLFAVNNTGSHALSVTTGSTTLSVASGDTGIFYTDGTANGLVTVVGSSGASGAAGGDLTGTYPNPSIAAGAVTLAKQANLAANSIQGNNTGSPATPLALSVAQVKTLLALAVADVSGAAPTANPTFTGTPAAPTAAPGTNTTQLSTTAFVQAAIAALTGGLIYKGLWNASTNSPTITSGVGTLGWFYKVSVAGTTSIDGISSWGVHDIILFDGTAWDKIDGQDTEVISVAGRTGAVVLASGDISGLAASATTDTTSATNITSGTLAAARVGAIRMHMSTFLAGLQTAATQRILRYHAAIAMSLPSAGNKASASAASTGTAVFTIKQNGSSIGTVTFTASATGVVSITSGPVAIAIDDIIDIFGPASADATLADITITLATTAAGA